MNTLFLVKLLLPISLIAGGTILLVHCNSSAPRQLNQTQTAMVDSLKTAAAPTHKELK